MWALLNSNISILSFSAVLWDKFFVTNFLSVCLFRKLNLLNIFVFQWKILGKFYEFKKNVVGRSENVGQIKKVLLFLQECAKIRRFLHFRIILVSSIYLSIYIYI